MLYKYADKFPRDIFQIFHLKVLSARKLFLDCRQLPGSSYKIGFFRPSIQLSWKSTLSSIFRYKFHILKKLVPEICNKRLSSSQLAEFLDGEPTSVCHFYHSSMFLSVCPSVHLSIYHAPYLRNRTSSDHNFWYSSVKWWYLQAFFSIFLFFLFWAVSGGRKGGGGGGLKGQKIAENEK